MTWEEQLAALQTLDVVTIQMRHPGHWFVAFHDVSIGEPDSQTLRSLIGSGATLAAAVDELWAQATDVPPPFYVVVAPYRPLRRRVRWDGAQWATLPE